MKSNSVKSYCALAVAGLCLLLGSVATANPTGKVEICHKAGERHQRILLINLEKDGEKHFGHGDYVVEPEVCDGQDSDCDKPISPDNGVDCDDGIACTVDTCGGGPGCYNTPDDFLCDDGDASTDDVCDVSFGGCVNTTVAATVDILGGGDVVEGDSVKFTLRLDRPVPSSVVVDLAVNGSGANPATAGADFTAVPSIVTIAPNEVVTEIDVSILLDPEFEPTEAFQVQIQGVSSPHSIGIDSAGAFIIDNTQPICGNGTVEGPEQCDDGDTVNNNECKNDCTINLEWCPCYNLPTFPFTVDTWDGPKTYGPIWNENFEVSQVAYESDHIFALYDPGLLTLMWSEQQQNDSTWQNFCTIYQEQSHTILHLEITEDQGDACKAELRELLNGSD